MADKPSPTAASASRTRIDGREFLLRYGTLLALLLLLIFAGVVTATT